MTGSDPQAEVIAIIIGRAGSKGLPRKNALLIAGVPMIAHTVRAARAAKHVGRIVVSTDGEEIADIAREAGAEVCMRPLEFAHDTATVDSAVRHAVEACGSTASVVVMLYGNVPVRPEGLIDRAILMLRSTGADSVQSYYRVGKTHPYWMSKLDADGRVSAFVENQIYRRQELPPLYMPDGGVIAVTRSSLFTTREGEPHAFFGKDRRGIENAEGAVIDVDTALDLEMAEAILRADQERTV